MEGSKKTNNLEPLLSEQGVIVVTVVVIVVVVLVIVLAVVITQVVLKPPPVGSGSTLPGFSSLPVTSSSTSGSASTTLELEDGGVYRITNLESGGSFALRGSAFPLVVINSRCNTGGLIALNSTISVGDNFAFQRPTNSPFVIPDDTYFLNDLTFGNGTNSIFATQANTAPNNVFQCSAETIDVNSLAFYYTFEKIQDISATSALFRILSRSNDLYLRICTETTSTCLSAVAATANFSSGPPISADFTLLQTNTDNRGRWIITKVG